MKKNTTIKLIEGGLIGAALGIAAGIMLAPKSGKKIRGTVKNKYAEFMAYLAPQFKKIKHIGEDGYDTFVKDAVKTYTKTKKLTEKEGKDLLVHAKKSWKHIKKEVV